MLNLNEDLIQEFYREARLEEARRHRLVQEALGNTHRHAPVSHRLMVRLGAYFIAWGWRLQTRYGAFKSQAGRSPSRPGAFAGNHLAAKSPANPQPCP